MRLRFAASFSRLAQQRGHVGAGACCVCMGGARMCESVKGSAVWSMA